MTYLRVFRPVPRAEELYLLEAVIRLIRNDYLEEKNPLQTVDGSFRGLVNSLDGLSATSTRRTRPVTGAERRPVKARHRRLQEIWGLSPSRRRHRELTSREAGFPPGRPSHRNRREGTAAMSLEEVKLLLRDKEVRPVSLKVLGTTRRSTSRGEALLNPSR